jgi:predicted regulator of Ras-like GTPase activity (Roadblock/LC7/MglB family)
MSSRLKISEEAAQYLSDQLRELISSNEGIYAALIISIDGHPLVKQAQDDIHESKLAAMMSSLLALGESIARESGQKLCQYVIVDNSDGFLVDLRVGERMLLTVLARKDTNLGMLLSACKNSAETIIQRFKL